MLFYGNILQRENAALHLSMSGLRAASSGLFGLQIGLPLAERGKRIHLGAVAEGLLTGRHILRLARPSLLRRGLQRTAVGEGQLPRQAADLVHRVEMRGRFLIGLATG